MYLPRLITVGKVLAAYKMRLALEFLGLVSFRTREPNPFIWTLAETMKLAADAGPNIGAVLDVWHWYHSGGTIADILASGRSRILHVHMSDAKAMPAEQVGDRMRLLPGEGIINLRGFMTALQQIGYEGGIAPEPLGRLPNELSDELSARLAYDTTLRVMQAAGVPQA
jgi:sugar phosphate isomerase/epimerase